MSNSVFVLQPYWYNGTWVFDDKSKGLDHEAFVAGAELIITEMVKEAKLNMAKAKKGFKLIFAPTPFPDYLALLLHDGESEGGFGNYYMCDKYNIRGWLCPALFKYFPKAPQALYAKVEAL